MKHHCYQNPRTNKVVISLGFRACAALGIRLEKHIDKDDVSRYKENNNY